MFPTSSAVINGSHLPPILIHTTNHLLHLDTSLPIHQRTPKRKQPKRRQNTQPNRQRLLALNRPRNRTAGQNDRSQQSELHAVGLALLDAVAAKGVKGADRAAGGDGRYGACAHVACDTAAGCEGREDVGGCWEGGLGWVVVLVLGGC